MDVKAEENALHKTVASVTTTFRESTASTSRQIIVTLITSSLHLVCGCSLAYSGVAVPQILEERNSTMNNETMSPNAMLWISKKNLMLLVCHVLITGSSAALMMPFSCVLGGFTIDSLGRLNSLKLSVIPNFVGWTLIATAQSNMLIIIGRSITGLAFGFATNSALVYISEISQPRVRGVMLSFPGLFIALGILLTYFKGWLLNWRSVAWISVIYSILPVIAILYLPESPVWLISKGRKSQARKSLNWFRNISEKQIKGEFQPSPQKLHDVDTEMTELIEKNIARLKNTNKINLKVFIQPTCYKPFIISCILFTLQQFSGIFILTFNSVIFFKGIGITMNPYETSTYISAIRLAVSALGIWLTKSFGRRCLIMTSAAGMAVCMGVSALHTQWIQDGTMTHQWVPIFMVVVYFAFASAGLQALPFSISAELFPQSVRGIMQCLVLCVGFTLMFAALHSYNVLNDTFGGPSGLQYFFCAVSLITVVFTYVFLPETFRKKLSDIEDYFLKRTIYIL